MEKGSAHFAVTHKINILGILDFLICKTRTSSNYSCAVEGGCIWNKE